MWCVGASSRYRPADISEEEMQNASCLPTASPPRNAIKFQYPPAVPCYNREKISIEYARSILAWREKNKTPERYTHVGFEAGKNDAKRDSSWLGSVRSFCG
mmetsp:Transcript_29779/g.43335  ORF Transcript_29779/g.43335 Transcript_29779/m.43335 type:complete len:101 (-) Transcript_29779:542-844(-)